MAVGPGRERVYGLTASPPGIGDVRGMWVGQRRDSNGTRVGGAVGKCTRRIMAPAPSVQVRRPRPGSPCPRAEARRLKPSTPAASAFWAPFSRGDGWDKENSSLWLYNGETGRPRGLRDLSHHPRSCRAVIVPVEPWASRSLRAGFSRAIVKPIVPDLR